MTLFGREYGIKGHGDGKYVEELADFINRKADEIKDSVKVYSTLDLVILTLLNVADELFRCKLVRDAALEKLEEKTERPRKAIDRVV